MEDWKVFFLYIRHTDYLSALFSMYKIPFFAYCGTDREMRTGRCLFLILVAAFLSAVAADSNECVYTLYVKTGSVIKAGTDSTVTLTFSDSHGKSVYVPDLNKWGLMGPRHDYFERDSTDIFTGRGPCIGEPICYLNLTSNGLGDHHGWFCETVKITSTGPHKGCKQSLFYVYQWLASDTVPYELSAVIDGCNMANGLAKEEGDTEPFEVRKPIGSASE